MDPKTIKIHSDETGLGYMIINEADFDPKVHKKYTEKKASAPSDPPAGAGGDGGTTPPQG